MGNSAYTPTIPNLTGVITSVGSVTSIASQTGTGTKFVVDNSPVLITPNIGVATGTSLATSAATPFLLTNGQLVNIALTSQTVGATTLTIPDFASVADEFTFKTKAQTMSNKTFVAPALGTPASGVLTNCTGTASGLTAGTVTTNANLTGEATSSGSNAVTLTNSAVIGKVLTGYTSGAGTVAATDSILQAIQKLNGNAVANTTKYNDTSFTSQTSVTVTHNFGAYPLVSIVDNTGAEIIPLTITHSSVNAFTVTFTSSTTGHILSTAGGAGSGTTSASSLTSGTLGSGVGISATSYSGGTISSGTYTPDTTNGNFQHITANGAFTLAVPATTCTIILEVLNGASAGTITTSGYTKVTGDTYATTNANKYLFYITKSQNYSNINVVALQ